MTTSVRPSKGWTSRLMRRLPHILVVLAIVLIVIVLIFVIVYGVGIQHHHSHTNHGSVTMLLPLR
jgi:uncharacterized membrane protein